MQLHGRSVGRQQDLETVLTTTVLHAEHPVANAHHLHDVADVQEDLALDLAFLIKADADHMARGEEQDHHQGLSHGICAEAVSLGLVVVVRHGEALRQQLGSVLLADGIEVSLAHVDHHVADIVELFGLEGRTGMLQERWDTGGVGEFLVELALD